MEAMDPTLCEHPLTTMSPAALFLESNIGPIMGRSASTPPPSSSSFFLNKFLPFASKHNHHVSSDVLDTTNHSGAPSVCATSDGGLASSSAAADKLSTSHTRATSPKMFKSLMMEDNTVVIIISHPCLPFDVKPRVVFFAVAVAINVALPSTLQARFPLLLLRFMMDQAWTRKKKWRNSLMKKIR
jgi:hypothetical protein